MKNTIVVLHNHFLKFGGASKVVLEQVSRLTSKGINCIIITTKTDEEVIQPYKNLKIIQLNNYATDSLFFWFTFPIYFFKLQKIIHNIDPEIIYCHSLAIYWGYFYKKLYSKIKLVYYLHDLGLPYTDLTVEIDSLGWFQKILLKIICPILKTLNKDIFFSANHIVANSQTSASYLYKNYKRKADAIVWPGVNTRIFKKNKVKKDYIFTVGRLERSKNIDKIICGFAKYHLLKPTSKTKLIIVGGGIEKNALKKLIISKNIEKYVDFVSQINSIGISKIASQARLGIFLGPYETFGIAAAESLSCGTPIIGINIGGIKEIVANKQVGVLTDGSPKSVSKALIKLLDNPHILAKMSNNTINFSKNNLSWDTQVQKLYIFLNDIQSSKQ